MTVEKIAVPSVAPGGINAEINTRFGRCEFFTIVSVEDGKISEVEIVNNPGNQAMGGAGPAAAQKVAQEGATIVIGGNYGPNAGNALKQGGIKSYGQPPQDKGFTVKVAIDSYLNGSLNRIDGSNVESHAGMN